MSDARRTKELLEKLGGDPVTAIRSLGHQEKWNKKMKCFEYHFLDTTTLRIYRRGRIAVSGTSIQSVEEL